MKEIPNSQYRKLERDFKKRVELMKNIPLEHLEKIFIELYDVGLKEYIDNEKKRFPNKSTKDIIIDMHMFHEKMKGRRNKWKYRF